MRFPSLIFTLLGALGSSSKLGPHQINVKWVDDALGLSDKTEYLASPYVAAGDRAYRVGHQNDSFPQDQEIAFDWVKYNTEWLVRNETETSRGLGAEKPYYPWESYRKTADQLKAKITEEFPVPRLNSYADLIGTASEALHLIDAAIIRADTLEKPWVEKELTEMKKEISTLPPNLKQGFVVFHNGAVNTPMEMGTADHKKVIITLGKAKKYVNPFGVFATVIGRDDLSEGQDGSFKDGKVFTYTGAVMTLPTGVQAMSENNDGRLDEALDYLKRMSRSFSFALRGSIYEVSPDYGMMAQAWNLYSYAVPILMQFFGIQPDAGNKTIRISPQMPADWDEAKIEKVIIGDNEINLSYKKSGNEVFLEINQKQKDWDIEISYPKGKYTDWEVKGENNRRSSTDATEGFKTLGANISVRLE